MEPIEVIRTTLAELRSSVAFLEGELDRLEATPPTEEPTTPHEFVYGNEAGKVFGHYAASQSVISNGVVTHVPNLTGNVNGDLTADGEPFSVVNGAWHIGTRGARLLTPQGVPVDVDGCRGFIVLGGEASTSRWIWSGEGTRLRLGGGAATGPYVVAGWHQLIDDRDVAPFSTDMSVVEVEVANGRFKYVLNGVEYINIDTGTYGAGYNLINQFFTKALDSVDMQDFTGQVMEMVFLRTDGTPEQDAVIEDIRAHLMAKAAAYNSGGVQSPSDPNTTDTTTVPDEPAPEEPTSTGPIAPTAAVMEGMRQPITIGIDRNWEWNPENNVYLPDDLINGQSQGDPSKVILDQATGDVVLHGRREEDGVFRTGFYKFWTPKFLGGLAECVMSSEEADSVLAWYTYHDNTRAEIDYEWIRNSQGVYGFALTLHMPRLGGGSRVSTQSKFVPYSKEQWRTPTRFGIDWTPNQGVKWIIGGQIVHEVTRATFTTADWDAVVRWDNVFACEQHGAWAGAHYYTRPSHLRLHGVRYPELPAA